MNNWRCKLYIIKGVIKLFVIIIKLTNFPHLTQFPTIWHIFHKNTIKHLQFKRFVVLLATFYYGQQQQLPIKTPQFSADKKKCVSPTLATIIVVVGQALWPNSFNIYQHKLLRAHACQHIWQACFLAN